jgi:hexosaminidase
LLGTGYSTVAEDLKQLPFSKSPVCQAKIVEDPSFDIEKIANYWAFKVNAILAQNGVREMIAWEDGLRGTSKEQYETPSVAVNFWETLFWGGVDGLTSIADDGLDIIMANPDYLYFDFPYEVNPEERGYYWGARFNSVYKVFTFAPENLAQNAETSTDRDGNEMSVTTPADTVMPRIRGMQGQTWSETIRTDDQYYEMVFPRVLAVAERAWHRASWELDWSPGTTYNRTTDLVPKRELAADYNGFVSALGCRELVKLRKLGILYRVPPPGASINALGVLTANSELPCTAISYSIDEDNTWMTYSGPVEVGAGVSVSLRSESSDGALKSRVVVVELALPTPLPNSTEVVDPILAVPNPRPSFAPWTIMEPSSSRFLLSFSCILDPLTQTN